MKEREWKVVLEHGTWSVRDNARAPTAIFCESEEHAKKVQLALDWADHADSE